MKYDNRVVLFLDILGFKKHVLETIDRERERPSAEVDNEAKIKELHSILTRMGKIASEGGNGIDIMTTQFSDSIVISFPSDNPSMATRTFEVVLKILVELIQKNIICRGALSEGKFIHTKDVLFEPALIDAYETESKAAMYPRVIMDKSIYDYSKMVISKETSDYSIPSEVGKYIRLDLDGKYFLDYFRSANHVIDNPIDIISYYKSLREIIIKGRKFQQPDLKVKYGWMRSKYNRLLNNIETLTGVVPIPVIEYLKKLSKIK